VLVCWRIDDGLVAISTREIFAAIAGNSGDQHRLRLARWSRFWR